MWTREGCHSRQLNLHPLNVPDGDLQRPKARVKNPDEDLQIESNVRYVIPEVLVDKSAEAGGNAVLREQANHQRTPAQDEIAVHILDIGTFSLRDIDTMKEWHSLSKRIKSTRDLLRWVKSKPESDARCTILAEVPLMNMIFCIQFRDLTKFAGEQWLSDACVFVAALHMAQQAQLEGYNRGGVTEIIDVDSVFWFRTGR
ncbi:hypothetical protein GQ600_27501 [Phytophthora cactorum]|nr:hypothetical protein GQ600_27501 [Phytophthora cactorum]